MIADTLLPMLQQRFPDRGLRVGSPPEPVAVFPAAHAEVGDVQIFDDGDELTLVAGNFTHGHFSNYDGISEAEKAKIISESCAEFLESLFADQVALWGSQKTGGGWRVLGRSVSHTVVPGVESEKSRKEYVWSGPRLII